MLETLVLWSLIVAIAALAAMVIGTVGFALKYGGRRADPIDDRDAIAASRFTLPVSLIVPLDAGAPAPDETVAALLDLNYPELEVIVVADAAAGRTLDSLKSTWALSAREFFYRRSLPGAEVQRIYRSARDPRLMLVEKVAGGRADALNCGVNLAHFRYFCVVDVGVVFDADALLRLMSAPLRDPAVVAATSHIERRAAGDGPLGPDAAREWLVSSRSLMESRVVWRTREHGLGPDDSVVAWRREAVLLVGGFSTQAADPDLELMLCLQTPAQGERGARPAVARTSDIFGYAPPRSRSSSRDRIVRHQKALMQLWAAWRHRTGPDWQTIAQFVTLRLIAPLCMAWVIAGTVIGAVSGWFAWRDVGLALVMLSLGQATITTAALLMRGSAPGTPSVPALARLLWMAPCELVLYGPSSAAARAAGLWRAFRRGPK